MAKQKTNSSNSSNNGCTCRMSHAKRTCASVAPCFHVTKMIAKIQINVVGDIYKFVDKCICDKKKYKSRDRQLIKRTFVKGQSPDAVWQMY